VTAIHIADTSVFVAMGRLSKWRYQAVQSFVHRYEIVFVVPERVYIEITDNISKVEIPPVDVAIKDRWARVADALAYSQPVVSRTMDSVQRYIANADDRPTDEIGRADSALAAVAVQSFVE